MGYSALVVEDDPALADVLRMKLTRIGHDVTIAAHQREAYHLLDKQKFDFVLLDLKLPTHKNDMDPNMEVGFAILDHIRDRFTQDELPVIIMTAYEETSQTAVRALKALANDYIQKPFEDSPVTLESKLAGISRQLEVGNISSSQDVPVKRHRIVFKKDHVEINDIKVTGRSYDILLLLGSRSMMLIPDGSGNDGSAMTGKEIAIALNVQEPTVRQQVTRFRNYIENEHKRLRKGIIDKQDIIRNSRDWKGYDLNFETAHISRE